MIITFIILTLLLINILFLIWNKCNYRNIKNAQDNLVTIHIKSNEIINKARIAQTSIVSVVNYYINGINEIQEEFENALESERISQLQETKIKTIVDNLFKKKVQLSIFIEEINAIEF